MARVTEAFLEQFSDKELHTLSKPCMIVVDMINGFVKEGALADPKIEEIGSSIRRILDQGMEHVFVADTHEEDAVEFQAFPSHCLKGSEESEVIDSLKPYASLVLTKNSTCTFTSPDWQNYYEQKGNQFDTFVITGCCTDICILQFALALKAYLNEHQLSKQIIVPISMVDTYHIDGIHDCVTCNEFALANMKMNAIDVVADLK